MSLTLYAVRIFTLDWEITARFYKDTLGLPEKFSDARLGWAEFDLGGSSLAVERLAPNDPEAAELVGRFVGITLAVEDIDEAYRRLSKAGVAFKEPPAKQPWGGILAHFYDPAGNVLTLLGR